MMDYPLLLKSILYRTYTIFPEKEIVSRTADGIFRYTYRDLHHRVCQLANALDQLGIETGAKVGSFAWNHYRHLELYYAVPCSQRVLHTINIRLFRDQLIHVINHAEDEYIFVDEDLIPTMEDIQDELPTVKAFIVMTDKDHLPQTKLRGALEYESLLKGQSTQYEFPDFSEQETAILGYTSATTGMPKGVEYSHRGLFLHCLTNLAGWIGTDESDVVMPVVPMFHVNAWCRPYTDAWAGAKQVYPGVRPTPQDLVELMHHERVTMSFGVPTVWMGVLGVLRANPNKYDMSSIRFLISGGSALPSSLAQTFEEEFGIMVYQGYGQTETSPVTFSGYPKKAERELTGSEKYRYRAKTGLLLPCLEMRLVDEMGNDVARDGKQMGELLLRGPWILGRYYKDEERSREAFLDGWFRTGDIATIDERGYLQVVDRTRDLIKSGGEWISSVDLENALMSHPAVSEAAVIAIPHEKWQERPLACVVKREGMEVSKEELLQYLSERVAKWWIPDDLVFISEIPKTSVGKFSKKTLRELFEAGQLIAAAN
ncbi:long-chain fatty acid--CoA ligase [Alicyclobacillus tolerans]|uniref:Fatty-acyl-CoA synthase n=1 Tax=Alicyclobacillus tolerans TaxID=90970 RepID=A0ABT9LTD1_9BACL|nr:long-chain fatty acid--CoA ligase [Alicyclobacillus tengchongensis]MDP9727520.1 fatty-acyl-CoA synthase [Alicyclobacillus tengchongensis]